MQIGYDYDYGYEEYEPTPLDAIKENLPKLIFLLLLIVVAYFAYKTFLLKYKVSIIFVNTENKPIEILSGNLLDEKGNIIESFVGSTLEAELKPGTYTIEFDPQNIYDADSVQLVVAENGSYQNRFVFERNYNVEAKLREIPQKFYAGQETTLELIRYINNSKKDTKLELTITTDAPFEIFELQPKKAILPPQIEVPIMAYFKVKPDFKPKKGKCQKFSAKLKIRYLKENNPLNKTIEFEVCAAPEIKIKPKSIKFGTFSSSQTASKKIYIENPSSVDLNLTLSLEVTSTKTYPESKVEEWFYWKECNAKQCSISIAAEDSAEVEIMAKIPELVENDSIKGNVIVSGLGIEKKVKFSLTTKAPVIRLTSQLSAKEFQLERIDSNISIKEATLKVKNESDITLKQIGIECSCNADWIQIPEYATILEPNQSFSIKLKISAPQLAENITKNCLLKVTYLDPYTQMKVTAESYDITINVPK